MGKAWAWLRLALRDFRGMVFDPVRFNERYKDEQ